MGDTSPESVLMCYRVADIEPHLQSRVGTCDRCKAAIWIALSNPTADEIWCMQCVRQESGSVVEVEPITKAQAIDVLRYRKSLK